MILTRTTSTENKYRRMIQSLTPGVAKSLSETPLAVRDPTDATGEWLWQNESYKRWTGSENAVLWISGTRKF